MSDRWLPIRYRGFHDIPRAFVVELGDEMLQFNGPFDDALDHYAETFTVYKVNHDVRPRFDEPSWVDLHQGCLRIGVVPAKAITFDATRRASINTDVLKLLGDEIYRLREV